MSIPQAQVKNLLKAQVNPIHHPVGDILKTRILDVGHLEAMKYQGVALKKTQSRLIGREEDQEDLYPTPQDHPLLDLIIAQQLINGHNRHLKKESFRNKESTQIQLKES